MDQKIIDNLYNALINARTYPFGFPTKRSQLPEEPYDNIDTFTAYFSDVEVVPITEFIEEYEKEK